MQIATQLNSKHPFCHNFIGGPGISFLSKRIEGTSLVRRETCQTINPYLKWKSSLVLIRIGSEFPQQLTKSADELGSAHQAKLPSTQPVTKDSSKE